MIQKSAFFVRSAVSAALLAGLGLPMSSVAGNNHQNHGNRPSSNAVTVYFTRHGEKQTTLVDTGTAADNYATEPDAGVFLGKNFDEYCGNEKCGEELNAFGLVRAELLADWFARLGVVNKLDAVYSSHKLRTYQTVAPTAEAAGLEVMQLPADGTELSPEGTTASECPTINAILSAAPGSTLLVAGHSGTLYDIMGDGNSDCAGLGLLTDNDASSDQFPKDSKGKVANYGDIWKVTVSGGVAKLDWRVNLDTVALRVVDYAR